MNATAKKDPENSKLTVGTVMRALLKAGHVNADTAERLKVNGRLKRADMHPLSFVAEQRLKSLLPPHKVLQLEWLTEWFAQEIGLPYAHIDPLRVDIQRVTEVMSSAYASRFKILPLEVNPTTVTLAVAEPYLNDWEAELKPILKKDFKRVFANPEDIDRYIVEFYSMARSVRNAAKTGAVNNQQSFEQLVELGQSGRQLDANDAHIVHVVDWLLQYAFEQRASDIHMEPRREQGLVRFRIDGVLHQVYQVPISVMSAMIARIKILGRMDVVERRRPQDGRIKTRTPSGEEVEMRLSTLPTAFGEKLVMRIFDPEVLLRDLTELGFSEEDSARWQQMTQSPTGIILVTGPTGSGKTTTLYSTLKSLATEEVNVCTVEDPIEMVEPSFNQMQVQHGIDLGFADGLRALMRQDPDIIMVGEIRDLATAEMAIQASLTGHLVLSTLHTNDAPSALTRMLELGVPSYLMNATILGVMAQRLVRTLCPHCKVVGEPIPEDIWHSLIAPWKMKAPTHVYRPVGCLECRNTGYKGRAGIYEVMLMNDAIRLLLTQAPNLSAMRLQAMKDGMKTLRVSGALKIAAGLTTLEEVLKVAPAVEPEKPN
ncbi:GspE/PulE family protein [Parvibium lacunae]|nr:GspE/PulE family protein [Parvibium lacunae]